MSAHSYLFPLPSCSSPEISYRHADILPVHCPPEVISEIFFQALPDDPQQPISVDAVPILLTRVCKQWRAIALSSPRLWNEFSISDTRAWSDESVESFCKVVDAWLPLSGALPISCYLVSQDPRSFSRLLDILCRHAHRWKSIMIEGVMGHVFPSLSVVSFRFLESLDLNSDFDAESCTYGLLACVRSAAPRLRSMLIYWQPSFVGLGLPWPNLTHLIVDCPIFDCQYPVFDMAQILANAGQCRNLILLGVHIWSCSQWICPTFRVTIPRLRELRLTVPNSLILDSTLRALILPELQHLQLCAGQSMQAPLLHTALVELLSPCASSILSMALIRVHVPDEELMRVLENLPNLASLFFGRTGYAAAIFASLILRFSESGRLVFGQNTRLEMLEIDRDVFDMFDLRLLGISDDIDKSLADAIESRWRLPSNAVDGDGKPVSRLSSISLDQSHWNQMQRASPEVHARIAACCSEGLTLNFP
ncbi:hypothetical protein EW146_g4335 [Bondarzewia mesenterica]|uniref:Uncharacterized protein n=1 Tax=Bondarzewia mesenterica TaxID=1095465 RepID=A0A4S4LUS7_9AGAM|nr:hypothetical protein EW146_g4335 [Bondarzewia mesenterica]